MNSYFFCAFSSNEILNSEKIFLRLLKSPTTRLEFLEPTLINSGVANTFSFSAICGFSKRTRYRIPGFSNGNHPEYLHLCFVGGYFFFGVHRIPDSQEIAPGSEKPV